MRHRANRSLHVLACAPVIALAAVALAPTAHAHAASDPRPVVVVLDAGHGGSPDNANPDKPYDPGAVGPNGLLEKDVALDVARRVRTLLQRDDVAVVLTRDSDVYLDIPTRSQVAVDTHADVFTSIHMNGFDDPAAAGSVTLYPGGNDHAFATTMAAAIDTALSPYGVQSRGTMLRDNWWIHVPCPVVTVEPVFITNPAEAALMARDDVRDALAAAIRDGIERQDPDIAARKAALEAYRTTHGGALPSVPGTPAAAAPAPALPPGAENGGHADPSAAPGPALSVDSPATGLPVPWRGLVAVLLVAAAVMLRQALLRGAVLLSAGALTLVARIEGRDVPVFLERFSRRQRRAARRRRLLERSRTMQRRSGTVYGELWD